MPSPKNSRSLADVRAECAALGITPGRSVAECERRIAEKRQRDAEARARCGGRDPSWTHNAPARDAAMRDAAVLGTGIMQVTTPGNERHVTFAEFAKAAVAEAPENLTPEEEQAEREAMAEYSAEMRRMYEIGETAWMAEQFKPRMSRTMRMLADCTAICGTLAFNPLAYTGDMPRHAYAVTEGWPLAVRQQVRFQVHRARLAEKHGTGRHVPNRVPMQQMWR